LLYLLTEGIKLGCSIVPSCILSGFVRVLTMVPMNSDELWPSTAHLISYDSPWCPWSLVEWL
jgi:hypothetical protein